MTGSLTASGIVTLTTDFGARDPYVGAVKGVILAHAPQARIVDISHEIPPYDVQAGAYVVANACGYFPTGTVHVAVVDPGVGGRRRAVAIVTDRYLLVGPDNGLFGWLLSGLELRAVYAIEMVGRPVSPTFHARDIFAPFAGRWVTGAEPDVRLTAIERLAAPEPPTAAGPLTRAEGGRMVVRVIWIDRFGNLVTGVRRRDLSIEAPSPLRGRLGTERIESLRLTYEGGSRDVPFFVWGSSDFLEVSVDQGSAAAVTGARVGSILEIEPLP